jgi:hypothetical protein
MRILASAPALLAVLSPLAAAPASFEATDAALQNQFQKTVRPFVETYCVSCHGGEKPEAELNLSVYSSMSAVLADYAHWDLVLERLEAGEMPSEKAKKFPTDGERKLVVDWIQAMRKNESEKNAGDPGPVLARRLSNAEYDYTIRDLTGVDIRPTKEFPIDPANQAGFDNSGESLAMSPALLKKYMGAARTVAEHLILKPEGFEFAPHPVVADTDRDKYSVLRIVEFYKRQPTDYADYFAAAWRYEHRSELGQSKASLADIASAARISPKYLTLIWTTLTAQKEDVGPIAKLQAMWRELPAANARAEQLRSGCEAMRDFVSSLREKIVPDVKNLNAPPIQNGSQTLVLWKDRQMAANRRRFDPKALQVGGSSTADLPPTDPTAKPTPVVEKKIPVASPADPTVPAVKMGGKFLAPAVVTTATSATFHMAASKKHGTDPDLAVPADEKERARYEDAFARFASVFPDAFYITERARVYLDAEKEQKNAGRLLSAGLHSMTGYFRDDGPLYDLVLDAQGQRELDRLWQEFDFAASVPQRMHTSFVWFERTDSNYMRDPEFDPYRPEDKSVTTQEKIRKLAVLYLAKAQRNNASEAALQAIREHFEITAANIKRVETQRLAAEPSHLEALQEFAARAFRRPLSAKEKDNLLAFYRTSRNENGLDHEEAMRDCIVAVLMSPNFEYRFDLIEASGAVTGNGTNTRAAPGAATLQKASLGSAASGPAPAPSRGDARPLSDYALASRLSYFLWASMPDAELLSHAASGDLHRPEVLAAQARRMLKDARIRNLATEFGGQWLDFRRFEQHNSVDRDRFPAFDNDLREAMFEEPIRLISEVARENRSILDFLYADYTFVNAPLAKHYGMTVTPPAGEWMRVEHTSQYERGGLLPMAVFLTANSPGLRTSPVKRGYWVVRRVLGERIPPPPPAVPALPNDEAKLGDLTLRDALARHRQDKACAGCHARFDSFGLVFEGFGAVGERRTTDFGGKPVDTKAVFPGGREGNGLTGLRDYIHAHRENDFVENLCRKLVAYALGRTLIPSDDTLIKAMRTRLAENDQRFSSLVECIVTSPQFTTKRSAALSAATTAASGQ